MSSLVLYDFEKPRVIKMYLCYNFILLSYVEMEMMNFNKLQRRKKRTPLINPKSYSFKSHWFFFFSIHLFFCSRNLHLSRRVPRRKNLLKVETKKLKKKRHSQLCTKNVNKMKELKCKQLKINVEPHTSFQICSYFILLSLGTNTKSKLVFCFFCLIEKSRRKMMIATIVTIM